MESSFEQGFKLRGIYKLFVAVVEVLNSYQAQIDAHITSGDNTGSRLRLPSIFLWKKGRQTEMENQKTFISQLFSSLKYQIFQIYVQNFVNWIHRASYLMFI